MSSFAVLQFAFFLLDAGQTSPAPQTEIESSWQLFEEEDEETPQPQRSHGSSSGGQEQPHCQQRQQRDRVVGVVTRCCLSIGSRFGRRQRSSDDDNGNHRE